MDLPSSHRPVNPRWTARDIFARFWQVLRHDGAINLWFKVVGELFYRRLLVIQRPLLSDDPDPRFPKHIRAELLTLDDLDEYTVVRPDTDREGVRRRIEQGETCVISRTDEKILTVCWASANRSYAEYLDCRIDLAPDCIYLYEALTLHQIHAYRTGRGIIHYIGRHFRDRGYRQLVGAVLPENRRALGVFYKMGFRPVGWVRRYRLGPWRRYSFRFPPGVQPFSVSDKQPKSKAAANVASSGAEKRP